MLIKGHSWLAEENIQHWIILTSKQVLSMKLATMVGYFLHDLDCDFENVYMAWPTCVAPENLDQLAYRVQNQMM